MKNKQHFGIVLPVVLISYFMILLDNSIVFTSTVKISHELTMNTQALSWISNAYILTFGGLLLLGGRLGDLWGRKRVFQWRLIIFSFSSLMVALSVNAAMMIAFRALQGVGSAIIAPATLALLMDNYTGDQLQQAIVYYGATAGLGASAGLLIRGLIASLMPWRVGFFINVPLGLAMIYLTHTRIQERAQRTEAALDIPGTALSVVGMTALVYSIDGKSYQLVSLFLAIILLVLFVFHERRAAVPLMPLQLFADPERRSAYIARFFFAGIAITFLFLTPQIMQNLFGFTPLLAALAFLIQTVPQFIVAMADNRLLARFTDAQVAIAGLVATVLGLGLLYLVGIQRGFWLALPVPMILLGIGQGLAFSPLTSAGVANAGPEIAGSASGVVNVVHQLGSSVGMSITVALTSGIASRSAAYNTAVLIMLVIALISLAACFNIARVTRKTVK